MVYRPSKKPFKKKIFPRGLHEDSNTCFETLINEIAEGIVLLHPSGTIDYANKAAINLLGWPKKYIIGKHFSRFVDDNSLEKAKSFFTQTLKGKGAVRGLVHIRNKKNKSIPIEFSSLATKTSGKVVQIHAIFRDITQRAEMEAAIRETEKMRALQHFIAGAAQEIRNPLIGLTQHLEKIVKDYAGRDFEYIGSKEYKKIFKSLKVMRSQAKYCYDTMERLLNIGKREIGFHKRFCSVNDAVKSAMDKVKHSTEVGDVKIRAQFSKNIPLANIGLIELTEILVNIITNSIQSITHNGRILIKTGKVMHKRAVFIEVIDNGVGISREDLGRVFEPFYTTKHRGLAQNSGLGLSIVYSIVKSYRGDIELKSSQRDGTRVKLKFPAKKNT